MGIAYGIDLGTTYSAIARLGVTGAPEIIPEVELGNDTLASAVYFNEDGTFNVGEAAKEEGVVNPERLHQFFKRWIGRSSDPNREHYMTDGREYDPIELSSIVLGRIIDYSKASGEEVKDVVITCPAYFDYAQRDATRQAGEAAGLNVLAVINEPTAAAIFNCFNRFNEDQTVLVYDLGGGTFDVTLMRMTQSGDGRNVEVLGTDGDAFLGGCDWDEELNQIAVDEYLANYGGTEAEMDEELKTAIRAQIEKVKIKLSLKEKVKIKIPYDGENITLEILRDKFEAATAKYVQKTVNWMDSVIEGANMTDGDIDVVLMVGGSTKMPMIKDMLIARFGEKAVFSDPDKSVAKGAAIVADMKLKEENASLLENLQQQIEKGRVRLVRDEGGKVHIESAETGAEGDVIPEIIPGDEFGGRLERLEGVIEKALEERGFGEQGPGVIDTNVAVAVTAPSAVGGSINITDIAPRTFGIIVGRYNAEGAIEYIVDNIVQKGEKTPCAYTRTYWTPEDNCPRLRFPVIESCSDHEEDPVGVDKETRKFIFSDSSLEMKQRQQLVLEIPVPLPKDSEILVDFRLDDLGNVYLEACEPVSNARMNISFSFNEIDKDELGAMRKRQEGRVYAVDF